MARRWYALYVLWAIIVGVSVTLQLASSVTINNRSDTPTYHSIYIMAIVVALGAVVLLPQAIFYGSEFKRPKYVWSLFGGFWAVPGVVSIPAGTVLGTQIVLLAQLTAVVGTALAFDIRRGRVSLSDHWRLVGFGVVVLAVAVENLGGGMSSGSATTAILLLGGTFASGVGYALQAKCNGRLSRDVGSTARAVVISAFFNVLFSMPLVIYVRVRLGVPLVVVAEDWPLFLFGGLQNAFYTGSLARLPEYLGYTTSYLTLLFGKLISSTIVDAMGVTGTKVPVTWVRCIAIVMVLAGTALFSSTSSSPQQPAGVGESDEDGDCAESAFCGSFTADGGHGMAVDRRPLGEQDAEMQNKDPSVASRQAGSLSASRA